MRTIYELQKSRVFKSGLGTVKDVEARFVLKEDVRPVMLKARNLPYAVKKKVEEQITSMVTAGIFEKIHGSPWRTPVVPVKKGEEVRICGDYKPTLNKSLSTVQYHIPSITDCCNTVKLEEHGLVSLI